MPTITLSLHLRKLGGVRRRLAANSDLRRRKHEEAQRAKTCLCKLLSIHKEVDQARQTQVARNLYSKRCKSIEVLTKLEGLKNSKGYFL